MLNRLEIKFLHCEGNKKTYQLEIEFKSDDNLIVLRSDMDIEINNNDFTKIISKAIKNIENFYSKKLDEKLKGGKIC